MWEILGTGFPKKSWCLFFKYRIALQKKVDTVADKNDLATLSKTRPNDLVILSLLVRLMETTWQAPKNHNDIKNDLFVSRLRFRVLGLGLRVPLFVWPTFVKYISFSKKLRKPQRLPPLTQHLSNANYALEICHCFARYLSLETHPNFLPQKKSDGIYLMSNWPPGFIIVFLPIHI